MFSFRTTPLENQLDKALTDGKVGCFCTQNCWDTSSDRYMYQIFQERGNLVRLFQPEDAELTPGTNHIHFDSESLKGLNAIVVEIQDVGSRYFNYTKDIFRLMMLLMVIDEPPALYIVDHINPAGRVVEGTVPTGECESFIPRVAHRHGLTLGELCNLFYAEIGAKYPLRPSVLPGRMSISERRSSRMDRMTGFRHLTGCCSGLVRSSLLQDAMQGKSVSVTRLCSNREHNTIPCCTHCS